MSDINLYPNATDEEIRAEIRRRYGPLAAFLDQPEVGPILMRAIREGRDLAWVQGQLYQTNWWQTTTEATRQWDAQANLDPATAGRRYDQAKVEINKFASRQGITLTPGELHGVTMAYLRYGWSQQELQGAVEGAASRAVVPKPAREFEELQRTDPTSAQRVADTKKADVSALAGRLGVPLSPERLNQLTFGAILSGWSEEELRQQIVGDYRYQGPTLVDAATGRPAFYGPEGEPAYGEPHGTRTTRWVMPDGRVAYFEPGNFAYDDARRGRAARGLPQWTWQVPVGAAGELVQRLQDVANAYLQPISEPTLQRWVQQILAGTATPENFQAYVRQSAKSQWPGLAEAIDAGQTVEQYAARYKELAARRLGIHPDSIDLMDPKWSRALDQRDPKTGAHASMSLWEWDRTLQTDPAYGYDLTPEARGRAAELAQQLARQFGYVG